MALNEIQRPTKQTFYDNLQQTATEIAQLMDRWREVANFINTMDNADLDGMAVPTGQVRLDLIAFKSAINDLLAVYDGGTVTPTEAPKARISRIKHMR